RLNDAARELAHGRREDWICADHLVVHLHEHGGVSHPQDSEARVAPHGMLDLVRYGPRRRKEGDRVSAAEPRGEARADGEAQCGGGRESFHMYLTENVIVVMRSVRVGT